MDMGSCVDTGSGFVSDWSVKPDTQHCKVRQAVFDM